MVNEYQRVKEEILMSVSGAFDQRIRPHEVAKTLSHRLGVSMHMVRQAVRDLVEEGRLIYSYRDPTSYIEMAQSRRSIQPVS